MKLRLTEESCAKLYPTQGKGEKLAKRTHVPLLNRTVATGEVVELSDEAVAASLVLCGLMEPADTETGRAVVAHLQKEKAARAAAAEKIQAAAKSEERTLSEAEEREVESCAGYCGAIEGALARLQPKKPHEKVEKKEE